jgi:DNA-binding CsgD family transcriptional regulator
MRAHLLLFSGEQSAAASLIGELEAVEEATGTKVTPYSELFYLALRGDEARASALTETATKGAVLRGEGVGIAVIGWTQALLGNGLRHYEQAVTASERASGYAAGTVDLGVSNWALAELVEAAVRSGSEDTAAAALGRLTEITNAAGTDWALGVEARCRALLSQGDTAERLYQEAIARLGRTRLRPDLARAHLLYGEWLRGERRRPQARDQLRTAHGMLEAMGMDAFAERARRELQATGETARKRAQVSGERQLTAQEAQVARMARDGLSNPEIGARLFISARTVQYHLGKVFAKLDINARGQLHDALADDPTGDLAR